MQRLTVIPVLAGLCSALLTPMLIWLAYRVQLVESPNARQVHARPMPRVGGVGFVLATVLTLTLAARGYGADGMILGARQPELFSLLVGAVAIAAVGLLDDVRGLSARAKLAAQVLAAVWAWHAGIGVGELAYPGVFRIELGWLSLPATVFWFAVMMNAMNMIDGLDGLAAGIALIASTVVAIGALLMNEVPLGLVMLTLAGSLAGFLVFNFNPARIFMGDSGSLFLGYMLAGAGALFDAKTITGAGLALTVMVLGVPLFDLSISILRRTLERRSLFAPDAGHVHPTC